MKRIISVLLITVLVMCELAGCGVAKKSDAKLYSAAESELTGFKEYFSIENGTEDFSKSDSRYNIIYVQDEGGLDQEAHSPTFIIPVYDDGNTVKAVIIYVVGAESENPTISNSKFTSGVMDVRKDITMTPNTDDKTERAKFVAKVIYDSLVDIEGK
ncbi:MAG: hypothetical protein FWF44_03945 [Defluviitaleaceae bacterium]|nr:hypothetical protein [Defluviitaleaceae bacterium]